MKKDADSTKYLIAYLFFLGVTTARFFSEAHFARFADPVNLIFHHHYWFFFVFMMFLLNYKYILKMPPKRTWWLSFCSPVILIPILYHFMSGKTARLRLNYISMKELDVYFRDIFTFMIFSKQNQAISIELMVIVVGIMVFSYFISKKVVRSIIMGLTSYLSLMIFAGTVLIAPHKPERVLIYVKSSLSLQNFMSFVYFFAALVTGALLFSDELTGFFRKDRKRLILFSSLSAAFFILFQVLLKDPQVADRIVMIPHSLLYSLFLTVMIYVKKEWILKLFLLVHIIISSGIIYNCWFPALR